MKRLVMILCLLGAPVFAVQPDEMLDNPVLEERARDISSGLRCLVCRNESIDDSNADLASDMRILVRERLVAGDTNAEVVDFIVDRYGEYVLLNPRTGGSNLLLWLAGPLMLGAGLLMAWVYLRGRSKATEDEVDRLSEAEEHRLRDILKD